MEKIHFFALPVCLVTAMIACCPFNGYAYSIQQSSEIRRVTLQAINPQNSIPVGTVIPWPSDKEIPSPMWLPCNGQAVPTGNKYALIESLVGPFLPDYNNAVRDDVGGGGVQNGGYFLRASMGDAAAGGLRIANVDTTRFHKHYQKPHKHKVIMELVSPEVSGTAYGQKYYEYITSEGDMMTSSAIVGAGADFYARIDSKGIPDHSTNAGSQAALYKEKEAWKGGSIAPEAIGQYMFPKDGFTRAAAFVYPKDETIVSLYGGEGCVGDDGGYSSISMQVKATIAEGVAYSQAGDVIWGTGRGIMAGTGTGNDTALTDETKLENDKVNAEIIYGGADDSGETGEAETTPVYRNVLFIIKVIQ